MSAIDGTERGWDHGGPGPPRSSEPASPSQDDIHTSQRLLAETVGTFFLVLSAAGAAVVDGVSHGEIGRTSEVVVPGLTVMAVILSLGKLSGAHLNPSVTIAFAVRGDFPWLRVPGYVVAQVVGATAACLFLRAMFGEVNHLGATTPGPGTGGADAMVMELVLTAGLISVILGTASEGRNIGGLSAVAVGGYIALAGLWSSPISDASMNPARSLAPQLIAQDFGDWWIYVIGPIGGGLVAAALGYFLRGPGGAPPAREAAQGSETEPQGG
jgi:aquaporin Z